MLEKVINHSLWALASDRGAQFKKLFWVFWLCHKEQVFPSIASARPGGAGASWEELPTPPPARTKDITIPPSFHPGPSNVACEERPASISTSVRLQFGRQRLAVTAISQTPVVAHQIADILQIQHRELRHEIIERNPGEIPRVAFAADALIRRVHINHSHPRAHSPAHFRSSTR